MATWSRRSWEWIHPSYRDLVIDQLNSSLPMALRFLEKGGLTAISLALSQHGGGGGERSFPMMHHPGSWNALRNNIQVLLDKEPRKAALYFLQIFASLNGAKEYEAELTNTSIWLLRRCKYIWDEKKIILSASLLDLYYKLGKLSKVYEPSPELQQTWIAWTKAFKEEVLACRRDDTTLDLAPIVSWIALKDLLSKYEGRFVELVYERKELEPFALGAVQRLTQEAGSEYLPDALDDCETEFERLEEISSVAAALENIFPKLAEDVVVFNLEADTRYRALEEHREELREENPEAEDEDDWERHRISTPVRGDQLTRIFDDL